MTMMRDFICLHYMVNKNDNNFWIDLQNVEIPDTLKIKLELWKNRFPIKDDFSETEFYLFYDQHWSSVLSAMNIPNRDNIRKEIESFSDRDINYIRKNVQNFVDLTKKEEKNTINHKEYLTKIRLDNRVKR